MKYEVILAWMFGFMWMHGCRTEWGPGCVFVREKKTVEGVRELVTSKISEEQSWLLPSEAIHEPISWLLVCTLCRHVRTHRCQWAFMSMFKLSIWDRLSLWGKWSNQTDSNQLKTSTNGLPMGGGKVPTGAKSTNNALTHNAMYRWMKQFNK